MSNAEHDDRPDLDLTPEWIERDAWFTLLESQATVARAELVTLSALQLDSASFTDAISNVSAGEEIAVIHAELEISKRVIAAIANFEAAQAEVDRALLGHDHQLPG